MPAMGKRVLVVDDEADVARLLAFNLGEAGFEVETAASGEAALAAVARERPAVVVLDLMLPDLSGFEVCRRLRQEVGHGEVGVLMLTARGDEYDRIVGLEVGADDYVVKPFSVREVVLRVGALAKRVGERVAEPSGKTLRLRDLEVDPTRHEVRLGGDELSLRPLEYKLLVTLLAEPGRVWSRAELLEEVWGLKEETNTRTVDVHVKRLRTGLGRAADLIETVHGFGYRAVKA
jgi:two-component system, OmpR family, phosphate regulon response regulator PhoB